MNFRFRLSDWRRASAVFLLALSLAHSSASAAGAPYLWKIEGARVPSWIFGTIHLARPDVATPPAVVRAAAESADAVFTEIPMDRETLLALAPRLLLPPDKSLSAIAGPEIVASLKAELRHSEGGLAAIPASFDRLKPWAAAVSLLELDDQSKYPGLLALDTTLFRHAAAAGKETGGLETPAEQLAIFDDLAEAEQITILRETLAQLRDFRAKGRSLSDTLAALYLAGDLTALVTELNKLDAISDDPALSAKLMDRLLDQRNARMAERIIRKLRDQPEKSWFFAVGAAHLEGDSGLLAAFEKAGFKLTRTR
ncbi:MAG TPA: TraB/GumN family protein [Chthoniobacterales bacterium]